MKNRRTFVLAPMAAIAVVLAFASAAYACTTIVGSFSTTPSSGSSVTPGDGITATGTDLHRRVLRNGQLDPKGNGAPDGTQWGLYFLDHKPLQDGMNTCMGYLGVGEREIGTTSPKQDSTHTVTISGSIPTNAPKSGLVGPALVCMQSENPNTSNPNYDYATKSSEFVVL